MVSTIRTARIEKEAETDTANRCPGLMRHKIRVVYGLDRQQGQPARRCACGVLALGLSIHFLLQAVHSLERYCITVSLSAQSRQGVGCLA